MKGKKTAKPIKKRKPRTPKVNAKRDKVWFRCTADFKKMLEDKAQLRGLTMTGYVEYLVQKDKPKKIKV